MLLDYFERVFVINLRFRQDRRESLSENFRRSGLIDPEAVTWVPAVDGRLCPPPEYFSAGPGAWGCYQTHLRIVQDAAMDGLGNYLVIEDDTIFSPHASELLKSFMNQVPGDWDQLFLGGQHLSEPEVVPYRPMVLRAGQVHRTHAFALRNTVFNHFQQFVAAAPDYISNGGWHVDHQIGMAHVKQLWNTYVPSWWIAGQGAGESNIANQDNPSFWWPWERWANELPFLYLDSSHSLQKNLQTHIHFGDHLGGQSCIARDLEECLKGNISLSDWLLTTAKGALVRQKLPGICHPEISRKGVEDAWGSEVMSALEVDLAAMIDYPFNGLFGHPVNRDRAKPMAMFHLNEAKL